MVKQRTLVAFAGGLPVRQAQTFLRGVEPGSRAEQGLRLRGALMFCACRLRYLPCYAPVAQFSQAF